MADRAQFSVNDLIADKVEVGFNGPQILSGVGAPTVAVPDGSLYLRKDGAAGSTLYVHEAGAWAAK